MKYLLGILLLQCLALQLYGQDNAKVEIERGIKPDELPQLVEEAVAPLLKNGKHIKYYFEQSEKATYYELKFKLNKEKLSVKFKPDGEVVDIEVLRKFKTLPKTPRKAIANYLAKNSRHYKLERVQIQYTGANLISKFLNEAYHQMTLKYEIEAFIDYKKQELDGFYEFHFDETGALMNQRSIKTAAVDNVVY